MIENNDTSLNIKFLNFMNKVDDSNRTLYEDISKQLNDYLENQQYIGGKKTKFETFYEELFNKKFNQKSTQVIYNNNSESFKLALLNINYIDNFFNNSEKFENKKEGYMFKWENENLRLYKIDKNNKVHLIVNDINKCGYDNCDFYDECFKDEITKNECLHKLQRKTNSYTMSEFFDTKKLPIDKNEREIFCYKLLRGLGFNESFDLNTYSFKINNNEIVYEDLLALYGEDIVKVLIQEANNGLLKVFNKNNKKDNINEKEEKYYSDNKQINENMIVSTKKTLKTYRNTVKNEYSNDNKNETQIYTNTINSKLNNNGILKGGGFFEKSLGDKIYDNYKKLFNLMDNNKIFIGNDTKIFIENAMRRLEEIVVAEHENTSLEELFDYEELLKTYTTETMLDNKLIRDLKIYYAKINKKNETQINEIFQSENKHENFNNELDKRKLIFIQILENIYKYLSTNYPNIINIFNPAKDIFDTDLKPLMVNAVNNITTEIYKKNVNGFRIS